MAKANIGPPARPITIVSDANTALGSTSGISFRRVPTSLDGDSSSSGCRFQNASAQIFVMEKSVNTPTSRAIDVTAHACASKPALITASLAQNPDKGGMPPSENAGTKNNAASQGACL